MRMSGWSSDVCSSDLRGETLFVVLVEGFEHCLVRLPDFHVRIDRHGEDFGNAAFRPPAIQRIRQRVRCGAALGYAVEHLLPRHVAAQAGDEGVFGQAIGGQQLLEAQTIELSRLVVKSLFPMKDRKSTRLNSSH